MTAIRMTAGEPKALVHAFVPVQHRELLVEHAREQHRTLSAELRRAVVQYLERERRL